MGQFSPVRPILDLERLLRNVFPPRDRMRLVIVMEAYADRSSSEHQGEPLYAVAALLAKSNEWSHLQQKWRRALNSIHPPMDVLHTTDFLARWDGHPYGHWSDHKK